jgi:hypothetical protein
MSPQLIHFLETVNFSAYLIGLLSEDESAHYRILHLLSLVSVADQMSPGLLEPVLTRENGDHLFQTILHAQDTFLTAEACSLFEIILNRRLAGDLANKSGEIRTFLTGKIPDFCARFTAAGPYTRANSQLLELLMRIREMSPPNSGAECFLNVIGHLFDAVLANPAHTILHRDFLLLLKEMGMTPEVAQKCGFFEKIPAAFRERGQSYAVYWETLGHITTIIKRTAIAAPDPDAWNEYIENVYTPFHAWVRKAYGGPIPGKHGQNEEEEEGYGDYEYEYD